MGVKPGGAQNGAWPELGPLAQAMYNALCFNRSSPDFADAGNGVQLHGGEY